MSWDDAFDVFMTLVDEHHLDINTASVAFAGKVFTLDTFVEDSTYKFYELENAPNVEAAR